MFFKDLLKEYGNNFTVAYLNVYEDDFINIYLRVYPTKYKNDYLCSFRIDELIKQDGIIFNNHLIFDDREFVFSKKYLEKFVVQDFH